VTRSRARRITLKTVEESAPATGDSVKAKRLEAVASRALTPVARRWQSGSYERDDRASRLQTYQNGEVSLRNTDLAPVGQRYMHEGRWGIRGSAFPTRFRSRARRTTLKTVEESEPATGDASRPSALRPSLREP
jgi:hypothetical protein